jgi:large subunit ribosomal protein L32e
VSDEKAKGAAESEAKQPTEEAKPAAAKESKPAAKATEKAAAKPAAKAAAKATEKASKKAKQAGDEKESEAEAKDAPMLEVVDEAYVARAKPELDDATKSALELREAKKKKQPAFRRHEWWRYKRLGGKNASWRRPRGIHSKARRHFKYRPPVVSIGYRGPVASRGLHPSGFEEVLVHRPEDLEGINNKTQAARIGGTVGGRKAELIEKKADEMGIRVLNRRN